MRRINIHLILLLPAVLFVFCCGCAKEEEPEPEIVEGTFFKSGNLKFETPHCVFQEHDSGAASKYSLYFFTSGVGYYTALGAFYGSGSMVRIDLDTSIFRDNAGDFYGLEDLKETRLTATSGAFYHYYDFEGSQGTIKPFYDGWIKVQPSEHLYKFTYSMYATGEEINGTFKSNITILKP